MIRRFRSDNALEVFSTHRLVAPVPKQALVAPLRGLLARVVEFAFRFTKEHKFGLLVSIHVPLSIATFGRIGVREGFGPRRWCRGCSAYPSKVSLVLSSQGSFSGLSSLESCGSDAMVIEIGWVMA